MIGLLIDIDIVIHDGDARDITVWIFIRRCAAYLTTYQHDLQVNCCSFIYTDLIVPHTDRTTSYDRIIGKLCDMTVLRQPAGIGRAVTVELICAAVIGTAIDLRPGYAGDKPWRKGIGGIDDCVISGNLNDLRCLDHS